MRKGCQNGSKSDGKNTSKINATNGIEQIVKFMDISLFESVKPSKFVGRVIEFEGFARCVRERKFIKNHKKSQEQSTPKSIQKSMKNKL